MTKESQTNLITVLFVILFIGSLYIFGKFKNGYVDENPAYVIGYVYDIHSNSNSVIFRFFYKYNGKLYNNSIIGWHLRMQKRKILLKISKNKPDLWIHIDEDIPECIIEKPSLNKSWEAFPTCNN